MSEACTTPPAAPLLMPTQVLNDHDGVRTADESGSALPARLVTFGGSLAVTVLAAQQLYFALPLEEAVDQHWLELGLWLLLGLFSITFGWVALTAMAAIAGRLYGRDKLRAAPDAALRGSTVLLMPVCNEDPISTGAALAAMAEELSELGLASHFEIFILSDSSQPERLRDEEQVAARLRDRLAGILPVWYRRRSTNTAKKAGNIRDFVSTWGDRYDYMVVLDADSLIAGETLAVLVREMDADSGCALLQTLPRLYGGETFYARLQQFAAHAYGPVFARGLNAWQGDDGNYWGHNAIIRVRAMAAAAGLPCMPGPRPFGGEIRSHDFVEAALLRRAGWSVRMLPGLPGSWEECPPTLLDAAARDRRWAQGNVQHLSILSARGLRWPNRLHMLLGVMNYMASPLWLALIAIGMLLSLQLEWQMKSVAVVAQALADSELIFDAERMSSVFAVTIALLLLPKLIGLCEGCLSRSGCEYGRGRFLLSAFIELSVSLLHAPIVMMIHTTHLWEIFRGEDSGWNTQQRRAFSFSWAELIRRHGYHTLLGVLVSLVLIRSSLPLLLWMLPVVAGLMLAIPLSALSASRLLGDTLARISLLSTPVESCPPEIMRRLKVWKSALSDLQ